MSDERVGPCGEHCAVVDECDERGREITRLRAENEKLRAENNEAYAFGLHKGKEAAFIDYGIERLRAENEKLRDALVGIACNCEADGKDCYYGHVLEHCPHRQARAAAAALNDVKSDKS